MRRSDASGHRRADGTGLVALSRRQTVAIAAAGIAVGIWFFVLALGADDLSRPGYRAALACWVTLPYIFAGVVAWRRRPESRLGRLMVTAGFGTVPNFLVWSDNDFLFTVGVATQFLPPALYLHLFLAFPSGRSVARARPRHRGYGVRCRRPRRAGPDAWPRSASENADGD